MIEILNYILYTGLSAIIVLMVYRKVSFTMDKNINNVSAEEAHQLIQQNKELIILDVRTRSEYQSGHLQGSKSYPLNEMASKMNELQKYKDRPILVYCASGGRSPSAVRLLRKNDFADVYHLKSGLRNWRYALK